MRPPILLINKLNFMEKIAHHPEDKEAWICICGNTPEVGGFETCDENGEYIEPDVDGKWDGKSYVCRVCGRIINQKTLEITGQGKA